MHSFEVRLINLQLPGLWLPFLVNRGTNSFLFKILVTMSITPCYCFLGLQACSVFSDLCWIQLSYSCSICHPTLANSQYYCYIKTFYLGIFNLSRRYKGFIASFIVLLMDKLTLVLVTHCFSSLTFGSSIWTIQDSLVSPFLHPLLYVFYLLLPFF